MSSHREAPEISKDPVADSTDLYAFVSPDQPDTVTLIANYIPLQGPDGGPNFYEFGDDVLYEILVDNNGDARPDVTFRFRFNSVLTNPNTFLYNTGPIESLDSPNWNRRQFYSVSVVDAWGKDRELASGFACPPCRIGPLSTHDYSELASAAVHDLPGGMKVFAGQRAEGFYVDLGAIFDLGDLRPFEQLHTTFGLSLPALSQAGERRELDQGRQRALDRHPGADERCSPPTARARPTRPTPRRPSGSGRPPAASRRVSEAPGNPTGPGPGPSSRCPGSATRWSTR